MIRRILTQIIAPAFAGVLFLSQSTSSAQTLSNRWSFSEPVGSLSVTDSVSGVVGTLQGTASLDGSGNVVLDGSSGTCVTMPGGLVSSLSSVSIEAWLTNSASPDNVHLFSFDDGTGTGTENGGAWNGTYLRYVLHDQSNGRNFMELPNEGNPNGGMVSSVPGLGDSAVHVVCIYDPVNQVAVVYTNGMVAARQTGVTAALSVIPTASSAIGRSPWFNFGDPYLAGSISEFRIWSGALNPFQVAALNVSGPDTVSTNYGPVTSIQLQVAFQMINHGVQQAVVVANASGLGNGADITALSSYTSGNTSILTVNSTNGLITAVGVGSTTITASYGGFNSIQTITVAPQNVTLVHRYGFTNDASDSVSHADGTLNGNAAVSSGTVTLDGTSGTYVSLPVGVLTNLTAITFETWLTNATSPDNVCQFEFSSGSGTGGSYLRHVIHDQSNGRNQFEMTAGGNSQLLGYPGLGGQYIHVVCIYDPTAQVQAVFTNGALQSVKTGASIPSVNNLWTFAGSLGRSPWWSYGDPYMSGAIDEFRIYSGEMTPQRIAMDYIAGPDTYNTNDQGSLISIALQAAPTMTMASSQKYGLLVNYTRLSNFDIINNSIFPVAGLSVTSSDTNIIVIGANKLLTANNPGTATLTAVYQGLTNSIFITVLRPPLAPLIHRWSFNETTGTTAQDSIGGADATLEGTAAFDGNGNVVLDGTSGCDVSLPVGVLTNLTALTIETWLTNATTPDNVCQFEFSDGSGTGGSYLRHVIHDQSNGRNQFEMTAGGTSDLIGNPGFGGEYVHVVCIYDPTTLVQQVFTNGVMASSISGASLLSVTNLWTFGGALGRSPWWAYGDSYMAGAINEFRIYGGRLLPDEIVASDIVGPGTLLTTNVSMNASVSAGNATLSWPVAAPGFTLYSSSTLGSGAVWTVVTNGVSIVGQNYQVTVSPSGGTKFFRLKR
jgi:hypothetical protein